MDRIDLEEILAERISDILAHSEKKWGVPREYRDATAAMMSRLGKLLSLTGFTPQSRGEAVLLGLEVYETQDSYTTSQGRYVPFRPQNTKKLLERLNRALKEFGVDEMFTEDDLPLRRDDQGLQYEELK